jgi:hypothetical protein
MASLVEQHHATRPFFYHLEVALYASRTPQHMQDKGAVDGQSVAGVLWRCSLVEGYRVFVGDEWREHFLVFAAKVRFSERKTKYI